VKATQRFVVHSGTERFPIGQHVQAVGVLGLQQLLKEVVGAVR
jgi:hypothetical protein